MSAVPTLSGTNTFSSAGTAIAITNNATVGGTLSVTGNLTCGSGIITQGLVYEITNSIGTFASNGFSLSYGTGGVFYLPTASSITANMSMIITNIPTTTSQSYVFTVAYYQTTNRFYINNVRLSDTATTYILGTSSTYGTPLYNGGVPSLTTGTACLIFQQFTVFSFGATRYVTTSVSCCS